jgi:RecA/RadA recombinase
LPTTGITIFAGRFGSGKTEAAINYALQEARSKRQEAEDKKLAPCILHPASCIILIDLDIITPYFRTRETADAMQERGVEVVAPSVIGQHIHTPAITPQILGAIEQPDRPVVLDVGGDKQGARALGQYSAAIQRRGYTMHFVVNVYRPFTDTLEGLSQSIAEIESSSRLKVASLVSNPNLMGETTTEQIVEGHVKIEEFAQALDLPVALVCLERRWADELGTNHFAQPTLILDRYFVMSWE